MKLIYCKGQQWTMASLKVGAIGYEPPLNFY